MINSAAFTSGSSIPISVALGGTDAFSYTLSSTVLTVNVIPPPAMPVAPILSAISPDNKITRDISFVCPQNGYFFYFVALYYTENDSVCSFTPD